MAELIRNKWNILKVVVIKTQQFVISWEGSAMLRKVKSTNVVTQGPAVLFPIDLGRYEIFGWTENDLEGFKQKRLQCN